MRGPCDVMHNDVNLNGNPKMAASNQKKKNSQPYECTYKDFN